MPTLFNWSKKSVEPQPQQQQQVVEVQEAPVATIKKSLTVDEMLHKEVYSIQDALLQEALRIINAPSIHDPEKYQRLLQLHKMGFGNVQEVKELKEIDDKKNFQKRLKETIEYYQQKYPLNRFISEDAVKAVCKKYGLLLTSVGAYIAEIPERNQKELVAFTIIKGDTRYPYKVFGNSMFGNSSYNDSDADSKMSGRDLLILAPKEKLNITDKRIVGHIAMLPVKDPIILQSVKGKASFDNWSWSVNDTDGYLIVTSWGPEVSDENVVNKINN